MSVTGPQQQPAGIRLILLRTGSVQASVIPYAHVAPPVTPALVYPLTQPVRSRITLPPRGRALATITPAAPVNPPPPPAPVTGHALSQPAGLRVILARTGHVQASVQGSPVSTPVPPAATPLTGPVRTIPRVPPRGRVSGSAGAPVAQVHAGPPFRLPSRPVQARQPLPAPGRAATTITPQAPVNPPALSSGPPFPPLATAAGIRLILLRTGSVQASVIPYVPPPNTPAPVYPLTQPVQARKPLPAPGRAATMAMLPVPVPPPPRAVPPPPLTSPARRRITPPPRGRSYGNPGAPVNNPALSSGPPFPPLSSPAGLRVIFARIGAGTGSFTPVLPVTPAKYYPAIQVVRAKPGTFSKGRAYRNPGTPAVHAGPIFRQAAAPVRAPVPRTFSRGRSYGNAGAPVRNPAPPAVVTVAPLAGPVRARLPVPLLTGRAATMAMLPVPANPSAGPPFSLPHQPAQARKPLPPHGRAYVSQSSPVTHQGPPFRQAAAPVRAPVPRTFSKGRAYGNPGTRPVHAGPVFRQVTAPVRAHVPQAFSKGRAAFTPHGPAVSVAAPAYPLGKAIHAQPAVFLKGRIAGNAGAPLRNPTRGPVFRQATQPARYRIVLPPRGKVYGNAGAPIVNPTEGPVPAGTLYLTPGTITQAGPLAAVTVTGTGSLLTISTQDPALTISPEQEGIAPVLVSPPPDALIPSPDPVTLFPDLPG